MTVSSPNLWLGLLAALFSAITFALNLTMAKLVYLDGGNIHALNLVRPFAFALLILPLLVIGQANLRLPKRKLIFCALLACILTAEFYALLGALIFIPVALAVLINYIYPILVALYESVTGRTKLGPVRRLAIGAAFGGLALTLLASGDLTAAWQGIALALISAVVLASLLLVSERAMAGSDRRVVMFYMVIGAGIIMSLLSTSGLVRPIFPQSEAGWWAFALSTLCFVAATYFLFVAIDMVGPLRTAAVDNSSPIWAIIFGALLLGEEITGLQMTGGAIVIGAILLFQLRNRG